MRDDDNFLISKWELTIPKVTKQPNYLISYIATEASDFLNFARLQRYIFEKLHRSCKSAVLS